MAVSELAYDVDGWGRGSSGSRTAARRGTSCRALATTPQRPGHPAHHPLRVYRENRTNVTTGPCRFCDDRSTARRGASAAYFAGEPGRLRRRPHRPRVVHRLPARRGRDAPRRAATARPSATASWPRSPATPTPRGRRARSAPTTGCRSCSPATASSRPAASAATARSAIGFKRRLLELEGVRCSRVELGGHPQELARVAPTRRCDRLAELSALAHTAGSLHLRGHGEIALHLDVSELGGRAPRLQAPARAGRRLGDPHVPPAAVRQADALPAARRRIASRRCAGPRRGGRRLADRRAAAAAAARASSAASAAARPTSAARCSEAARVSGPQSPHLEIRCASLEAPSCSSDIAARDDVALRRPRPRPPRSRVREGRRRDRRDARARRRERRRARRSRSTLSSARPGRARTGSRTPTTPTSSARAAPRTSSCRRSGGSRADGRLTTLPAPLREIADLRVRYPSLSLASWARKCRPPATRPRLHRRLSEACSGSPEDLDSNAESETEEERHGTTSWHQRLRAHRAQLPARPPRPWRRLRDRRRERPRRRAHDGAPAQVRLRRSGRSPATSRSATTRSRVDGNDDQVARASSTRPSCRGATSASTSRSSRPASSPTATAAQQHLDAGAKKVLISAPATDPDVTIVLGVNDDDYDPRRTTSSRTRPARRTASRRWRSCCTTRSTIEQGFMTTIHAYTNDQRMLDLPHKDLRRARAAAINLIPTSTGAARAIGVVIPDLKGKVDGMSMRAPVPDRLRHRPRRPASAARRRWTRSTRCSQARRTRGPLDGILQYTDEPIVSTDIVALAVLVHLRQRPDDGERAAGQGLRLVRQRVGLLVPARRPRSASCSAVRLPRSVRDADVAGKRVLVRADLNVPLEDGRSPTTPASALRCPRCELLLERGAAEVAVCSHLGRPKGRTPQFAMAPVRGAAARAARRTSGSPCSRTRASTRGETKNDPEFARELADGCDLYVNDAFGSAHRAHASTVGVAQLLPAYAGLLLERELEHARPPARRGRAAVRARRRRRQGRGQARRARAPRRACRHAC